MTLESWSLIPLSCAPWIAPECRPTVLRGVVYGHPKHADGKTVQTSPIVAVMPDGRVRTASGGVYALGEVDPTYAAKFPNARERLVASRAGVGRLTGMQRISGGGK